GSFARGNQVRPQEAWSRTLASRPARGTVQRSAPSHRLHRWPEAVAASTVSEHVGGPIACPLADQGSYGLALRSPGKMAGPLPNFAASYGPLAPIGCGNSHDRN